MAIINKELKKILITGVAGFIGRALAHKLLLNNYFVIGIDNLNDYYCPKLKLARVNTLKEYSNFEFIKLDLTDQAKINDLFAQYKFDKVINLAAQAGVRYSLDNPKAYIDANIVGFLNILEACRYNNIEHLIYASSSSVYGGNTKLPFSEDDRVDNPISLYAATKKSNELMAHTYSHLFGLKTTGLRFFTVYGPWGRPDMALYKFVNNLYANKPIEIYNSGKMIRDFTYIDDIVNVISKIIEKDTLNDTPKDISYNIYNIGNNSPVNLLDFISYIEKYTNKKFKKIQLPMQPGDVKATHADVAKIVKDFDYEPNTSHEYGIAKFIDWYNEYTNVT